MKKGEDGEAILLGSENCFHITVGKTHNTMESNPLSLHLLDLKKNSKSIRYRPNCVTKYQFTDNRVSKSLGPRLIAHVAS